jgi:hypothetical protein
LFVSIMVIARICTDKSMHDFTPALRVHPGCIGLHKRATFSTLMVGRAGHADCVYKFELNVYIPYSRVDCA